MDKSRAVVESVRNFWMEVVAETVKCEWPSKRALVESTLVVIVTVALLSLFVYASDRVLITLSKLLLPSGG